MASLGLFSSQGSSSRNVRRGEQSARPPIFALDFLAFLLVALQPRLAVAGTSTALLQSSKATVSSGHPVVDDVPQKISVESKSRDSTNNFGPQGCVSVTTTPRGTCALETSCGYANLASVEFAFVCFNPGTAVPHALHSFGRGGFAAEESFDTGVPCAQCTTVSAAFDIGGPLVRTALQALPGSWGIPKDGAAKSEPAAERSERSVSTESAERSEHGASPEGETSEVKNIEKPVKMKPVTVSRAEGDEVSEEGSSKVPSMKPAEAAFYGPSSCVATFRSPAGSCIVQTRCVNTDISDFNIGVTCLDKKGGYVRYLFGRGSFQAEETFDTRLECELCLGVSEDPEMRQMKGMLPKQLVEDVNTLKVEVKLLREQVSGLMNTGENGEDGGRGEGEGEGRGGSEGEAGSESRDEGGLAEGEGKGGKEGAEGEAGGAKKGGSESGHGSSESGESEGEGESKESAEGDEAKKGAGHGVGRTPAPTGTPMPTRLLAPAPAELASAPSAVAKRRHPIAKQTEESESAPAEESTSEHSAPAPASRGVPAAAPAMLLASGQQASELPRGAAPERAAALFDGEDTPVILHHRQSARSRTLKDLLARFAS